MLFYNPPMPVKQSEAIVLRTYPLREADLLVTLFTRSEGKVKGVAKSAKRSQKRFGGALEPLTCVRAQWQDREGSELARLESCDVLLSPLASPMDYPRCVALAHVGEMLDDLMPEREVNDSIFRLAWGVVQALESGEIWLPVTYFDLWMLRLMGFLRCSMNASSAASRWWEAGVFPRVARWTGLLNATGGSQVRRCRWSRARLRRASSTIRWVILLTKRVRHRDLADLRKFLMQILARHLDRKLQTSTQLERLE